MSTIEFISHLQTLGFRLFVEGGKLCCEGPKEAMTAELGKQIGSQKEEIIRYLEESKKAAVNENEVIIPAVERDRSLPLSTAQQRLWFLDQLEGHSKGYNIPSALRLEGELNVAILEKVLTTLVERHETLRTLFEQKDGEPVQVIRPAQPITLPITDLRDSDTAKLDETIKALADEEAMAPFKLDEDSMLRVKLLRLSETEHILLLTMHHIASDGWSMGVLVKEITTLYLALLKGETPSLPELEIQYADYACWQRNAEKEEAGQAGVTWWKNRLSNLPEVHSLPLDKPRPAQQSFQGKIHTRLFNHELLAALNRLSRETGTTLFTTLQAAFALLLSRYSNENDVVMGTPVSNRPLPCLEPLIGFFINTVVLRTDLSGDPTFAELLEKVQKETLEAYQHQDVSFEQLVEELQPTRSLSHAPLFQIMIVMQNNEQVEVNLPNLKITSIEQDQQAAKFDLNLFMVEEGNELTTCWEYNIDLFETETIERMAKHFEQLLQAIVQNPKEKISTLSLLSGSEKEKILNEWNQTKTDLPKEQLVHELIEKQAEESPNTVALIHENQSLTYQELNQKANQLAHYLREQGVGPDKAVGICMKRSSEMVIALLAVMKAGGAYLPLDPAYPKQRLAFMIEDAAVAVLLTSEELLPTLEAIDTKKVCLDQQKVKEELTQKADTNISATELSLNTKNLVYIIYTSGSTGKPKGVMITHQGAINYLNWAVDTYKVESLTESLVHTSFSFDATVTSLLAPLVCGKRLVMISEGDELETLGEAMKRCDDQLIKITPAHLQVLAQQGIPSQLASDRSVFVIGGEELTGACITPWLENLPNARFINEYGPTETVVGCCVHEVEKEDLKGTIIPIGLPIANTELYILDTNGSPVPVGVPGELYIGGSGVARGYLNRAELTAERFLPNPFATDENSKIYKTGDLVRWRTDGKMEYLGRIDQQVKLRGFRIELGEIESNLLQHESIKEAVVLVHEEKAGDKRLVAWLVADSENRETLIDSLKADLLLNLPDYMRPTVFVFVDALPLTPNGKVDRKALPKPEFEANRCAYVAPETETEKTMAAIWQEIIGLETIGINDNFFDIGGHSILAVRLTGHMQKEMAVAVSLKELFEFPTIAQLAKQIDGKEKGEFQLPELLVDPKNRYEPFPLSDVQQAYWIGRDNSFELGNVGTHGYAEFPIEDMDPERFSKALNFLIQRHDMLRVVVTEDGQQKVLETVPDYEVRVLDLREEPEEEGNTKFHAWREELSHQFFTGLTWPLFDIRLTRFREGGWKIHYSMDALVMDGASHALFVQELTKLYADQNYDLPKLNITFRDYLLTEKRMVETGHYEKSKNYWLDRIAEFPLAPELPLGQSAAQIENPHFERREMLLKRKEWKQLKEKAKEIGVTPTVFLLGSFGNILKQWSKNHHFTLNLTLFNRIPFHKQVEQLLGDFTSLTLLEMDYRSGTSFTESLKQIQDQLWNDLEHKYFSGVEVLRELSRENGETVSMPVVVTSMLGIDNEENEDENNDTINVNNREQNNGEEGNSDQDDTYSISQTPQVWLDHQISEFNGELLLVWDSVEGLFPEKMLDEMFATYKKLLHGFLNSESSWQQPAVIALPERQQTLRQQANETEGPEDSALMHELFLKQAKKSPDAVAICSDRKNLTYIELAQWATQIATQLRKQPVQPNELVAIVMEKGWEQVAASIGIQIAGAAWLPIDATLPEDRIQRMLELGQVNAVVSISAVLEGLTLPEKYQTLAMDKLEITNDELPELPSIQKREDLAYVIFTSGSTGEPKGVMIDHRGAVNTIVDINERFQITEKDRVLALSALSFDLSVYDVFGILAAGGALVIPEEDERRDPESWLRYLQAERVTVWNTVPALMQMMVEYAENQQQPLNLRLVMMSGDWIPLDLPDRIKNLCEDVDVISLGGATEASIWSILHPIGAIQPEWKSIPYGKPMKNQTFHVLKEDLSQAPEMVPGELYIGGIGLAKGYWKDTEKTASSFITHPKTEETLYKTGDLGRYKADGSIEFLGRNDFQVKVQGYRIELGEIETALTRHEMIRDAVVVAKGERDQNKQLVGYILPEPSLLQQETEESAGDNVGDLADSGNSITDATDRSLFKLEEHGIRKQFTDGFRVSLKQPVDQDQLTLTNREFEILQLSGEQVSLEAFSSIFNAFSGNTVDGLPLTKYFYPSAGNLYPVQTCVYVNDNSVEGVAGGFYYYHPKEHALVRLSSLAGNPPRSASSEQLSNANFALFLIGDMDAIQPMYGNFSRDFVVMEAGYMAQLLINAMPSELGLQSVALPEIEWLNKAFALKEAHLPINCWIGGKVESVTTESQNQSVAFACYEQSENEAESFTLPQSETPATIAMTRIGRKSYRTYQPEPANAEGFAQVLHNLCLVSKAEQFATGSLKVYLFVKPNGVEGWNAGFYRFDPFETKLTPMNEATDCGSLFRGNDGIYDQAGFALFLVRDQNETTAETRDADLYYSGYIGQAIMNGATDSGIGFCAIGTLNQAKGKELLKLNGEAEIVHSFLAGSVSQEQIETVESFNASQQSRDPQQILSDYLAEQLPQYMIPKVFMLLEEMPLTANGKVNRKALPEPELETRQEVEYVAPETEEEKQLAAIWQEVLGVERVSIHDNFFNIGGQSLIATRMKLRIDDEFSIKYSLKEIFATPILKDMAKNIEGFVLAKAMTQNQKKPSISIEL